MEYCETQVLDRDGNVIGYCDKPAAGKWHDRWLCSDHLDFCMGLEAAFSRRLSDRIEIA